MHRLLTKTTFRALPIAESILQGLDDAGYIHCTPIQAETLPIALKGRDVAGQAQTGTGKTAAFLVPTFDRLLLDGERKRRGLGALILAPTRELAMQIYHEAELLGKHSGLRIGLVYGGAGYAKQLKDLSEGVDVLVGTPGRLIDFYKQKAFHFKDIEVVVLDEADRMFDLGFISDIRYLLRRMPRPAKRLGLLFSATLSYRVTELAYEHMNQPELIRIEPEQVAVNSIRQGAFYPSNEQKMPLLIYLLRTMKPFRSIVFVNTRKAADEVNAVLAANGFDCGAISGDVPQVKRQRMLARFRDNRLAVLVATDVAARGLHIPDVSHIFNFDLPQDVEDYVHRIGRTARFGAAGEAVSFVCEEYVYSLPEIEAYIGHKIPMRAVPVGQLEEVKAIPRPPRKRRRPAPRKAVSSGESRKSHNRRSARSVP
jgi:ATP-dependent RNA helicase RhlB